MARLVSIIGPPVGGLPHRPWLFDRKAAGLEGTFVET